MLWVKLTLTWVEIPKTTYPAYTPRKPSVINRKQCLDFPLNVKVTRNVIISDVKIKNDLDKFLFQRNTIFNF